MSNSRKPRRSSVKKAEWSFEREQNYRKMCDMIAQRRGIVIAVAEGAAYLEDSKGQRLICRPMRHERFWYETWLALEYNKS